MENNDIYAIVGRIKNILAREDIALTPVVNILINTYALVLKDLYDFSEKLPTEYREDLQKLLMSKEGMPEYVIRLNTPKEETTLYERFIEEYDACKPEFDSVEEALESYQKRYDEMGGYEFWVEAENSSMNTEEYNEIMSLSKRIGMCKHLIQKNKDDQGLTGKT